MPLLILAVVCPTALGADFVHPMEFNGTEQQKDQVIQYITETVEKDYCGKVDMCDASTLRMMEASDLKSFKQAAKAKNREIMDTVIHDYCHRVDMCSYSNIWMMYQQNLDASTKKLKW
ncbi:hypothetical protein IFT57_11255 [Pseudomonas sp. CFBP 13719]|nr:hypothetical protein [Pseudomonas sp. CFBP 13719]